MTTGPLFEGLVVDDQGEPVRVAFVGGDAYYVVDDDGFLRHIESEVVDRQVLDLMRASMEGHESLIAEGTMKMLGQEDIFTKAMIEASLKNLDEQFDQLIEKGIAEDVRMWLGMMGFQVVINVHGDVIRVNQPSVADDLDE